MLTATGYLALLLLLSSLPVLATTVHTGKVVGITDGDTLTLPAGTPTRSEFVSQRLTPLNVASPTAPGQGRL